MIWSMSKRAKAPNAVRWVRKPIEVEAVQWFKLGDHPRVELYTDGGTTMADCGFPQNQHGKVKTATGYFGVCPGSWVITDENGLDFWMDEQSFKANFMPISATVSPMTLWQRIMFVVRGR
jgi:hypothetical protein